MSTRCDQTLECGCVYCGEDRRARYLRHEGPWRAAEAPTKPAPTRVYPQRDLGPDCGHQHNVGDCVICDIYHEDLREGRGPLAFVRFYPTPRLEWLDRQAWVSPPGHFQIQAELKRRELMRQTA